MKKLICFVLFTSLFISARSQTLAQIKKELDTTSNPVGYVKYKLKKKYKIDTIAVISSTSFMGLADSLAYKGKQGKVYGPFKGNNVLIKILAKVPNNFYHVSHIVLDTSIFKKQFADSLASDIINRIQSSNSTFAAMASTYSADAISAARGGDLGWFVRGVMMPPLDKAIGTHKKGEIFKVWTPAGLHIVTLTDNPKQDAGYALFLRVFL